jgi:hypothetical protein
MSEVGQSSNPKEDQGDPDQNGGGFFRVPHDQVRPAIMTAGVEGQLAKAPKSG